MSLKLKRCAETGKLLPAAVKIGDIVITMHKGFNPGFTSGKGYKVVKTARSKDAQVSTKYSTKMLENEYEFAIIDDDGLLRYASLKSKMQNVFPSWEVIRVKRK